MICSYATLAIIRSTICACFTIAILFKDKRIPRIMAISTQCCPRIIVAIIAVTSISASNNCESCVTANHRTYNSGTNTCPCDYYFYDDGASADCKACHYSWFNLT